MRTARARTLRIAGRFPDLRVRQTVRSDDVPCRREDSGNGIPGSSRFAPYIGVGALSVALARFRVGQTVSPEVGTKPAIPKVRAGKHRAQDQAELYRETEGSGWTIFFR